MIPQVRPTLPGDPAITPEASAPAARGLPRRLAVQALLLLAPPLFPRPAGAAPQPPSPATPDPSPPANAPPPPGRHAPLARPTPTPPQPSPPGNPASSPPTPAASAPATPIPPPPDERIATLRLRPAGPPVTARLRPQDGRTLLDLDGATLLLPGRPARLVVLPIAGRQVLAAGVTLPSGQVLAVLAGWDGDARILAVESWDWRGAGPRSLGLRLSAVPDDRRLLLLYQATLVTPALPRANPDPAATPAPRGPVTHAEAWTDVLAWQDGALRTEPLRPVLPGTWQARMAAIRARVAALLATPLLATPRLAITTAELTPTGLLDPLGATAP